MYVYFVTGGAGFIGSNFVKYLLKKYRDIKIVVLDSLTYAGNFNTIEANLEDYRLSFIKGSIGDVEVVSDIFQKYPINFVINFAAESHVDRSIIHPRIFFETNVLGTQNLLEITKKYWTIGKNEKGYPTYKNFVKYLQISTDEVYGSLDESGCFVETTPLSPHSPYSASKAAADLLVKAYSDTYKMPVNITRCSNNYGPYQFPEKLIPLAINNILEGRQLPIYGKGQNVRDWIYVEDHCKAIDLVLHKGRRGELYNVGGNNERKNIDVVKLIISTTKNLLEENVQYQKVLHLPASKYSLEWVNENLISFTEDRLGHDKRYALDFTKITMELGWQPDMQFERGVLKTICWYLENQDWVNEVTLGKNFSFYEKI
ncbi:MAG: dTDP-glucose 4,6-dehydratase [Candidatus Azobacteroides pseudotrichonymphae]|nr:dTDP-glucose 4,6-dehydratase [Bacteroidales bacterium OttesenSCG-928-I14]GMO34890.1 MAG: dTDP-glucose 4,6-dehydratase [Candidatus Azobacteroides pseudotrichonymphae]